FGLHIQGEGIEFIEREQAVRRAGDLMIAGPGVPHYFNVTQLPFRGIAIYFLPSILCEFGPHYDGFHILRRFTSKQVLSERMIRPPAKLRKRFLAGFTSMHEEFVGRNVGCEIRLRTLLMEML